MNKEDRYIQLLCKRIKEGKFDWERYQCGEYYGIPNVGNYMLQTTRTVCSYGLCGFSVSFPESHLPEIQWDWELREMTVDELDFKEWLYWAEHYDNYYDEWLNVDTDMDFNPYIQGKYHVAVPSNY